MRNILTRQAQYKSTRDWYSGIQWSLPPVSVHRCHVSLDVICGSCSPPNAGLIVKSWSSILNSCSDLVIGDFVMSGLLLKIGLRSDKAVSWSSFIYHGLRSLIFFLPRRKTRFKILMYTVKLKSLSTEILTNLCLIILYLPNLWVPPSTCVVSLRNL